VASIAQGNSFFVSFLTLSANASVNRVLSQVFLGRFKGLKVGSLGLVVSLVASVAKGLKKGKEERKKRGEGKDYLVFGLSAAAQPFVPFSQIDFHGA
jgi:hypothetical protein